MRTRIKFCGITCVEDGLAAAAAGADAVGFVFYPRSPVVVDADAAAEIAAALPPFVSTVALFVDADAAAVGRTIERLRPDVAQFHGNEDAAYCRQFGVPYIKACRVRAADELSRADAVYADARALLADGYLPELPGGTGKTFDWQWIPGDLQRPLIVAGGLTADNVGALVGRHRPWGVDVSGGIARADDKRRKDSDKMRSFVENVYDADRD